MLPRAAAARGLVVGPARVAHRARLSPRRWSRPCACYAKTGATSMSTRPSVRLKDGRARDVDGLVVVSDVRYDGPGCLGYDVYESATAPGTFFDMAAQDAHLMTPHVQAARAALDEHLRGALDVHPLDPIDRARPAPVP